VVAGWLAAIGIVTALSSLAGGEFRDMATVPGTPSDQAIERLRTSFPAEAGASAHVVAKTNGVSPADV
jgi:RND superfamily putative drug exporter